MDAYRKRPVTIWAEEFTGTTRSAITIIDWAATCDVDIEFVAGGVDHPARTNEDRHIIVLPLTEGGPTWVINDDAPPILLIHTLEGVMRADVGDLIIQGVKNEFYPCKPDVFASTYERI